MPHFVSIFINFFNDFETSVHMGYHLRQTHCLLSRRGQDPVFWHFTKTERDTVKKQELVNLKP